MSSAKEKNAQALQTLLGSTALVERLASTRICVVTPPENTPPSGQLLAQVLADVLARLWPNIDFYGSSAQTQLQIAKGAAASGAVTIDGLKNCWEPPYHCVVAVGCEPPAGEFPVIRVSANEWQAKIGTDATCGDSDNPVGPAFAAALAAAQVFHRIFEAELHNFGASTITEGCFDVRDLCSAKELATGPINVGHTHLFGVGAVSHGLIWLLEKWPEPILGKVDLVDPDEYGFSNGQRYAFMSAVTEEKRKVYAVRNRLRAAHKDLVVEAHQRDINSYCAERGYEQPIQRAIAGLDSAESRRHVALKLPASAINMWTSGVRIGAGRYVPETHGACLACEYLEDTSEARDEVARVSQETGLRPDRVRVLLDTAEGLGQEDANAVSRHRNIASPAVVGQPLRSVLPILCATAQIQMQANAEPVDVPFSFASLFAGISGFMMLLKDTVNPSIPSEGWTQHVFKMPSHHMYSQRHPRSECVCCSELRLGAVGEL